MRQQMEQVVVDPSLLRYIALIVQQTRSSKAVFLGASPRASVAILQTAKAMAMIQGRDFVTPEDYGSRQRSWQIAPLLSSIASDYKTAKEQAMSKLRQMLFIISILALSLVASVFYVNRQRKRLTAANRQLSMLNAQLYESNKVKEEYVGRFLRLCSLYIDKMDNFRKRINKMVKIIESARQCPCTLQWHSGNP